MKWSVELRPVVMEGCPEAQQTWLHVGAQSFQVGDAWETLEEAAWYADQLRTAMQEACKP